MKYKELFTEGNGLFATYFYPDFGDEYQTIFARTPPKNWTQWQRSSMETVLCPRD